MNNEAANLYRNVIFIIQYMIFHSVTRTKGVNTFSILAITVQFHIQYMGTYHPEYTTL